MAESQNSKQNVQAPETGQTVIVNAIPGQDIVLEAAFDQAEVKMDGGNVVFEFANGGQVVLDFTDLGDAQAPNVVMPDGTVLDMQEFLAALGEKEVEPAAGPEAGTADSGGVGDYQDDPGERLDGLDMLDGLEDDPFPSLVLTSLDADDVNSLPELLSGDSVLVEDESLPEGNNEDDGGVGSLTGTIVDNVNWGADGFGEVTGYNVGGAAFAAGSTVFWGQNGAFLGTSDEGGAASLIVNADGTYTFSLIDNMLLGQGVQGEQTNLLATVQIIGADTSGDEVPIPLALNVEDDVPEIDVFVNAVVGGTIFRTGYPQQDEEGPARVVSASGSTVDSWFFSVNSDGPVTIDTLAMERSQSGGGYIDINGDGQIKYFDPYVYVFTNNGGVPGTLIGSNDDGDSSTYGDGSIHDYDSYLSLDLSAGDYILVIGAYDLTEDEARTGINVNEYTNYPVGVNGALVTDASYKITFGGDVTVTDGPEHGSISLPPLVTNDAETIDVIVDDVLVEVSDTASASFAGLFGADVRMGADDPGTGPVWDFKLSLTSEDGATDLRSDGDLITLSFDEETGTVIGSTDSGTVFTIEVDAGTGEVTLTQFSQIDHMPESLNRVDNNSFLGLPAGSVALTATATVVDEDGDVASDSETIDITSSFGFKDDLPTVENNKIVWLNDENAENTYADPNFGGVQNHDPAHTSGTLNFDFGADGEGKVVLAGVNLPSGQGFSFEMNDEYNLSLKIFQDQNGERVEVADVILTDSTSGNYTVTQLNPVFHPTPGVIEEQVKFVVKYKVIDGDNDLAVGQLVIKVDDDTPEIFVAERANILSESFEDFSIATDNSWKVVGQGGGDIYGNNGIKWTVNEAGIEIQSGNIGGSAASEGWDHAELDSHGRRGDGGTTLTELSTDVRLPSSEVTLTFDYRPRPDHEADSGMKVSLGGVEVTIGLNADGSIKVDGLPSESVITAPSSTATDWTTITLAFSGLIAADGNAELVFSGLGEADTYGAYLDNINMYADRAVLTVDETTLGDNAAVDLSGFFVGEFGADGEGDLTYSLSVNGADLTGLRDTVTNELVKLVDNGAVIEGRTQDTNEHVFTVSVNGEGIVELDQIRAVKHPTADANEPFSLNDAITLTAQIADADGDTASSSIDVGLVFKDDGPLVEVVGEGDPANLLVLSNFDFASSAGHHNSYGYYIKDATTGEPDTGVVVWNDVHDYGQEPSTITVSGYTQGQIGFFIISNGGNINSALSDNAKVVFDKVDGKWQAFLDDGAGEKGTPLGGFGSPVIFDEPSLNADGLGYMIDKPGTAGNQNWEDLPLSGPDADFNDVNINAQWTQASNGLLVVDESNFEIDATLDLSGAFKVNYGSDGPGGALTYAFDLKDGASGLIDTATDLEVILRSNTNNTLVQGYIDNNGVKSVVFEMSVDGNGVVTLDQQRAVVHDDARDPIEALGSAAKINPGLISLVATATDGDHDTDSASLDVGQMVRFEDDGPSAANAARTFVEQIPVHVSGFQAGFVSASPSNNVLASPTDLDADPLADAYYWGGDSTTGSGYKFVDNEDLRGLSDNLAGSTFKLGTFSHINRPIESGSSVTSVDLRVKFMVNGELVEHTITLDHDETTNSNNAIESKDGIEINSASFNKVFSVDGQQFELKILGFVNSDGTIVTSISTFEDNVNLPDGPENFSLMASISPVTAPVIAGEVNPDFGADGRGEVIWGGEKQAGADGEDDYYVTVTDYGTFTGYADGSYKFVRSSIDVKESYDLNFGYTVRDGDGDEASANLKLTITDSSEVTAVDDFIDARSVATETSDAVTHTVIIPESVSVSSLAGDFEVDPGGIFNKAAMGFGSNNSDEFVTSGPVTVVFDLHVQAFQGWDTGKVFLQKFNGFGWTNIDSIDVEVRSVNDREFNIEGSGTYRIYGEGLDLSNNGNFKFKVWNIEGETIVPAQTSTINQYFVDVDWNAASQKTGNVLWNDPQSVEGALVAEVDNNDVHFGGTMIEGTYGSLTIHPDGAYSYTPSYAPDDTDYIGGTLTESFTYKLVQPDGDFDTATLTFDVTPQLPVNAIEADASHVAQGSDQADFIFGTSGDDTLSGLAGNDYINGGSGDDSILGGDGNDHLIGAAGDDTLVGGDGDDLLTGGAGDDSMTGGAGVDVFKYVDGDLADVDAGDIIADFNYQQDHLDLSELLDRATIDNLGGYLRVDSFSHTQIKLSVDADGGGNDFTTLATINISNLDSDINQSNVLNEMINDGVLKIG